MGDFFIYVFFEGKDDNDNKMYINFVCSYKSITDNFFVLEEFVDNNPLWGCIWIDLFGLEGLVIPVVELFDDDKIAQAVNFIVTFMGDQYNPCHDIPYLNRVYVFKEANDEDCNSLLASFVQLQMLSS